MDELTAHAELDSLLDAVDELTAPLERDAMRQAIVGYRQSGVEIGGEAPGMLPAGLALAKQIADLLDSADADLTPTEVAQLEAKVYKRLSL
jgi:hypothetical protein